MNGKRILSFIALMIICSTVTIPTIAFGAEIGADRISGVTLPTSQEGGESPLNFILDPFMLVYETDAERYGGGIVEEGATLLFHNSDGEYDFSSTSDELKATNQGSSAVNVRVDVSIESLDDVKLKENEEYEEDEVAELYLAVIDNSGNEQVLSPDEPITLQSYLDEGESFSFGLKGSCNPNGGWSQVKIIPCVKIIWQVESIRDESVQDDVPPESESNDVTLANGAHYDEKLTILDIEHTESSSEIADEDTTKENFELMDSLDSEPGISGDSVEYNEID